MNRFFIYALKIDEKYFYVGQTANKERRLQAHRVMFGESVRMEVLEIVNGSRVQALEREKYHIFDFKGKGYELKKCQPKERNGRAYLGVWIDPIVIEKAKEGAKKDKRTLAAYVEMGLSNHNDFFEK